jgi:hypothetical protein
MPTTYATINRDWVGEYPPPADGEPPYGSLMTRRVERAMAGQESRSTGPQPQLA